MSAIDDGGPAFPGDALPCWHNGMSLRDYFAAKAPIPDEVLGEALDASTNNVAALPLLARWCYAWADAMLAERGKRA